MNWQELGKDIGILAIIAGLITWLFKQLGEFF